MTKTTLTNKRLLIFILFTISFLIILSCMYYQNHNPLYLTCLMFTPMVSLLLTRILTKEGFENMFLKPLFKKNKKYYFIAYFITPLIAFFGALVYFVMFPNQLDLLGSKFAFQTGITTTIGYVKQIAMTIPLCVLINPLGGIIPCLGEEIAWRGYLLPKLLEKFSTKKAVTLTGVIWGLWHSPIIAMGFNYGTKRPLLGVLMMIVFCTVININFSYLFLKTNTIWVPVIAHAALNAIDKYTPSYLFTNMDTTTNLLVGPNVVGIIGSLGFIIVAYFCYRRFKTMELVKNH